MSLSGVIKLRDQVIPVISLRKQFGWREPENLADTKIIIVEIDNAFIGINVDDADAVVHVPSSAVEFPYRTNGQGGYDLRFAKLQDYLLILLDIRALFSSEVMEEIAEQSADQ